MKNKLNQMFKDKLFLVMLVLGLLTIVAAAGVVTIQRKGSPQENPYMDMQEHGGLLAGESNAQEGAGQQTAQSGERIPDTLMEEYAKESGAADATEGAGATGYAESAEKTADLGTIEYADAGEAVGGQDWEQVTAEEAGAGADTAKALILDFSDASKMNWPVRGNIVLDYSMDSTIYFPTLDQYKCNPGLVIQGAVSDPVYAPANARVLEFGVNEEIGNYLVLDFGNDYTAVCGQLKEVPVSEGEYLEKGQLLGYVAEPTKYYTVEGSNIYFALKHGDQTVDPLDYLE